MADENIKSRLLIFTALLLAMMFVCTATTTPASATTVFNIGSVPIDSIAIGIDPSVMQGHIEYLADNIGVRIAGTDKEREAENYICYQLESFGYIAEVSPDIQLHNGRITHNVTATLPGQNPEIMVIGAHYDSKSPAPGANDNGSGVAVVLELARVMSDFVPPYTVVFALFGSEEIIDGNSDHHHYGSRFMAANQDFGDDIFCMTSIDMVGVGSELWIDNMGIEDDFWRAHLFDLGGEIGLPVHFGEKRGQSDHESFEHVGIPVAWVHWRYDSHYHSVSDTSDRINPDLLAKTADLLLRGILGIDGSTAVPVRESTGTITF